MGTKKTIRRKKAVSPKAEEVIIAPVEPIVEPEAPVIPEMTPEDVTARMFNSAYHGGKDTERAVDGPTGKLLGSAIVASVMSAADLRFTEAECNDGTVVRVFDNCGSEAFRFFLSKRGKWSGQFGVSGKARTQIEAVNTNDEFGWVRQSESKNYYFSGNTAALMRYLGA